MKSWSEGCMSESFGLIFLVLHLVRTNEKFADVETRWIKSNVKKVSECGSERILDVKDQSLCCASVNQCVTLVAPLDATWLWPQPFPALTDRRPETPFYSQNDGSVTLTPDLFLVHPPPFCTPTLTELEQQTPPDPLLIRHQLHQYLIDWSFCRYSEAVRRCEQLNFPQRRIQRTDGWKPEAQGAVYISRQWSCLFWFENRKSVVTTHDSVNTTAQVKRWDPEPPERCCCCCCCCGNLCCIHSCSTKSFFKIITLHPNQINKINNFVIVFIFMCVCELLFSGAR